MTFTVSGGYDGVVIRPIELPLALANQRAPSAPAVIPYGLLMLGSV